MKRRDLLRTAGAAAALSFIPRNAEAAWPRLLAGYRPVNGLTAVRLALVAAMADAIIPRTDTPGATDVRVPDWVDLIVAEYYTAAERTSFLAGLDAIEARARATGGAAFAELAPKSRNELLAALDDPADPENAAAAAYARLKRLVVHGYFTSERVQKEVLRVEIWPGRFDGAAPMPMRHGS